MPEMRCHTTLHNNMLMMMVASEGEEDQPRPPPMPDPFSGPWEIQLMET